MVSGLGAATADAIYGLIAAFGLTYISALLISQQSWIRLVGGLFLLFLGAKTLRAPVVERPSQSRGVATAASAGTLAQPTGRGLLANYASTFLLTLTNPMTILSFAAIFAGLGVGATSNGYGPAAVLVLGVFLGSALWWLALSTAVSLLRSRVSLRGLRWVNRVSGLIILGFGLVALASLVSQVRLFR
jgi:threonine/homoserine/homoserine lactone efflux protein